jgi:hypothetical protein
MRTPRPHLILLAMALTLAGCDNRVAAPRPQSEQARLRLVHGAAESSALNLSVDGTPIVQGLASTGISPYVKLNEGNHQLAVTLTGSGQQLIQRSVMLDGGKDYSFLVSGSLSSPEGMLASDTARVPIPGKVKIRVLHAARGAQPLDVYLTPPGQDLATANTLIEPFEFGADTTEFPGFAERDPGPWEVRFTDDGTLNVVLDTGPFSTLGGQLITVVLSMSDSLGLVASVIDETPSTGAQTVFVRVVHDAAAAGPVAVHITEPGADLNLPHLFISPLQFGADSSTVTFLLPVNGQNSADLEVRFTEVGNLNLLASTGSFNVPLSQRKRVTLQPAQGGGYEAVVTNEP